MLFDMHIHTSLSPCSSLPVEAAIIRAGKRGLDGICITDHHTMDVRHAIPEGIQGNGICVIFGMEYSTSRGDFLLFGPFEALPPDLPADRLLQTVDQNGGVAVAAHPFRGVRPVDEQIIADGLCGAVESINGRNTPLENRAVESWQHCYQLTACGGSDAHTVDEVAAVATRFSVSVRTRADLISALKSGMCRPEIPVSALPAITHRCQTVPSAAPL